MKAAEWILSQPWAMLPIMIDTMVNIADRNNVNPEAVAARVGKPLERAEVTSVRDGIAVIPVRGPISRYGDWFTQICGATSVDVLATDLREALDNPDIKGIVVEIDSPGGQAAGIGELAGMIREGSKVKPVTCYVSNIGASAAYWLAAAGSKVVGAPSCAVGSIGVVWPVDASKDDEDGPRVIEFVSSQSPNKRPDPDTDSGRAEFQRTVDAMAEVFIGAVADYRGMKPAAVVEKFGAGGLLVGSHALKVGMLDSIGTLEGCIADLAKDAAKKEAKSKNNDMAYCESEGVGMKINFPRFITGLMSKGFHNEVVDSQDIQAELEASAETHTTEPIREENTVPEPENTNIDAIRAQLRAEMATELRNGRVSLYGQQADAWLSLHGDKITPAEKDSLKAAYVASSLIDAESPVPNFSALDGFRASVESRKPHGATTEIVTGDLNTIKDHLGKRNLKTLDNAAATPEEAKAQESESRLLDLLGATEEGRAVLADMQAAK